MPHSVSNSRVDGNGRYDVSSLAFFLYESSDRTIVALLEAGKDLR